MLRPHKAADEVGAAHDAGRRGARRRPRLAASFGHALARRSVRLDQDAADRLAVHQAARLSRSRLSRRRRLHGPRQLGDLARRRLQVRLRAAHHRADVEPDGDPAPGALHQARHRLASRPRPSLPRRLPALRRLSALGARRACHLRDGSGRGDRHGDWAQSPVRHSARDRRAADRARRVSHSVDAAARLPLCRELWW